MISACAKAGMVDKALEIWEEIEEVPAGDSKSAWRWQWAGWAGVSWAGLGWP